MAGEVDYSKQKLFGTALIVKITWYQDRFVYKGSRVVATMIAQIPSFSSVGVAIAVMGIGLVCFAILAHLIRPPAIRESFLAPTLGIDALDSDLRILYLKTLVFDAERNADHREASTGRALRRLIFSIQALRETAQDHPEALDLVLSIVEGSSDPENRIIDGMRKTVENQQRSAEVRTVQQNS